MSTIDTIEVLRLGTNVHVGNHTWPHIRRISLAHLTTRYIFTTPTGRTAEATVIKSPDPNIATTAHLHTPHLNQTELDAQIEFLRDDLTADPYSVGPLHLTLPHSLDGTPAAAPVTN